MSSEPTAISNKAIRQLTAVRLEELHDCRKLAKARLHEAGIAWLETRKPFISASTIRDYTIYIATIARFFGNVPLEKLANPDRIRAYQLERSKNCAASRSTKSVP